jgi:hypothetical protein
MGIAPFWKCFVKQICQSTEAHVQQVEVLLQYMAVCFAKSCLPLSQLGQRIVFASMVDGFLGIFF